MIKATLLALLAAPPMLMLSSAVAHATTYACPETFYNPEYPHSGGVTPVTSCPFAEDVRAHYVSQPTRGVPVDITAYSPVTGESYDMTCEPGIVTRGDGVEVPGVECSGGNAAVVLLW